MKQMAECGRLGLEHSTCLCFGVFGLKESLSTSCGNLEVKVCGKRYPSEGVNRVLQT